MQGARLLAFTENIDLAVFKIEICKVKRMDLTDPQAELIHQGINGVVADAQEIVPTRSCLPARNASQREAGGAVAGGSVDEINKN